MPTRKQLIDQARADQRARSARARADNPKSAIVGIGDRDPLTGQYQVLLPTGSVEMGEKQFNSSLPKGSQVLGVPQSTGCWLLDERDVQPIKPISTSSSGKIKILYSQIEGDLRVFYLWGDRPKPKRIFAHLYIQNQQIDFATVSNLGKGDRYIINLQTIDGTTNPYTTRTQSLSNQPDHNWENVDAQINAYSRDDRSLGYGFWQGTSGVFNGAPFFQPRSYSIYKGVRQTLAAAATENSYSADIAILPNLTRVANSVGINGITVTGTSFYPFAVSEDLRSSIYVEGSVISGTSQPAQYKLFTPNGEIILGGDLSFRIKPTGNPTDSFIGNRFFSVTPNLSNTPSLKWDVEVYLLGTNTTKSTIKANVTYKHTPDKTFHNASYHP